MLERLRAWLSPAPHGVTPAQVQVAACALLQELAHADGHVAPLELAAIHRVVRETFALDDEAVALVEALAEAARDARPDLLHHARVVREGWPPEDRERVVAVMRDVIWADGRLDPEEERLAASLAALLGLDARVVARTLHEPPDVSPPPA